MSRYVTKKTQGNTAWFTHDRFGMFIHFGLYSLAARHEWVQTCEKIPPEKYAEYAEFFNPDMYDPREWAKSAKAAGMKYAVMTAKHHEGFCLFDTKYTDFKSTNTPIGRDLIKEYVEAFRAEGLKVGIYYSLLDWHHPDFTIDRMHPLREDPDAENMNKSRDMHKYAEYMRNQLTELMSNYGKIDILWLDFSYDSGKGTNDPAFRYLPWMGPKLKEQWESEELIKTVRNLQPEIIIDNRADIAQDIWTPEQVSPSCWVRHPETNELVVWEACQTFSGSWGYHRDEMTWKSPEMLIKMLIDSVSFGGNLIMNVGPTARGYIDERAEKALDVYAKWMKYNSRSIYGCTMADPEFTAPEGCRLTQSEDGKRLYIHLITYPFHTLEMPSLKGRVKYAQFLHDASEVEFLDNTVVYSTNYENLFWLPDVKPNVTIPVIEVFLKD